MAPESLLQHYDSAALWPAAPSADSAYALAAAYQDALALRSLRLARGEKLESIVNPVEMSQDKM